MKFKAKKLTDSSDQEWIAIYLEGQLEEPLALIRDFEANDLANQIREELEICTH